MSDLFAIVIAVAPHPGPLPASQGEGVTGFSVSVERIAVRVGASPRVAIDPLMARVVLEGLTLEGKSQLCPTVERTGGKLALRCNHRRIWGELAHDARGAFIDLRELRGVSWLDLGPMKAWSLKSVLLPDVCPGTLAAARGECALARGEFEVARAAWTEGLDGPDVSLCHLRLGDLAIRAGELESALAHYAKVPPVGFVGRMGHARECELLGTCLSEVESNKAASTEALPDDMSRELRLLTVRRELAAGRDAHALQVLLAAMETDPDACEGSLTLCQKLLSVGLQSTDVEARIAGLSAFLTEKARKGPAEYELNQAASRTARELGAPAFAASILSANTPKVPREELSGHLLEIIALYLTAHDPVRAGVVLEYAEGKLGAGAHGGGWVNARRQLGRRTVAARAPELQKPTVGMEALSDQVSLSTDLARAAALRSRASTEAGLPENAP